MKKEQQQQQQQRIKESIPLCGLNVPLGRSCRLQFYVCLRMRRRDEPTIDDIIIY